MMDCTLNCVLSHKESKHTLQTPMPMMIFRKALFALIGLLSLSTLSLAQDDAKADALRDVQIGMQGLMQATEDPALLAQLMRDMQDPELMAEAQKMMKDPEFQKQMKDLSKSKEFKDSVKKTQEKFNDPNTAAHAEAKMEHMLKVGNEQLKKGAGAAMEETMAAMMSNPEVMQQMQSMLKDPNFKQQLEAATKTPEFQSYIEAMQDMLKDPAKKKQFEAAQATLKASL